MCTLLSFFFFFFFNDTATTEIYTLSLHDALPISDPEQGQGDPPRGLPRAGPGIACLPPRRAAVRSEEHTSELQSHSDLVCRLLLEKKKKKKKKQKKIREMKNTHSDNIQHYVTHYS